MLVETSHQKIPPTSMLGNSKDVLSKETDGNGHVSRNIRLSLLSADLVEPYVSIVAVNDLALSDDIVPLVERNCTTASKRVMIPQNMDRITVEWTVGGSLDIDETALWIAKSFPQGVIDCLSQPSRADVEASFVQVLPIGPTGGSGYFSASGPTPHPRVSNTDVEPCLGPIFSTVVDVSSLRAGETLSIIASSRVDRSWAVRPNADVKPDVPPQSHVVNARTNPDWHFESAGKRVKGRLDWFSTPVTIVVGDYDDNVGQNQAGRAITTMEVSNRFGQTTGPGGASPFVPPKYSSLNLIIFVAAGVMVCLLALSLFVSSKCGPHSQRIRVDTDEEDGSCTNETYSDEPGHGQVEMM